MKTLKVLLTLALFLLIYQPEVEAQINFKKLKDKAKKVNLKKGKGNSKISNAKKTTTTQSTRSERPSENNKTESTSSNETKKKWEEIKENYSNIVSTFKRNYFGGHNFKGKADAKDFFEKAKELNYPKLVPELKNISEKIEGIENDYTYKNMANLGTDFEKQVESYNANVKRMMNEALTNQSKEKLKKAADLISGAEYVVEGILLIIPNHEKTTAQKQEVQKYLAEIKKDYEAKVFTSDFHKEHKLEIMFSKKPIEIGKEDPAQFTKSFNATDNIYAIVYLDGTLAGLESNSPYHLYFRNYLDGEEIHSFVEVKYTLNKDHSNQSYLITEIIPDPSVAKGLKDAVMWEGALLSKIPRGKHELYISLYVGNTIRAAETINVNWDGYDAEKIKNNATKACLNADNNLAKSRQLPPEFSKPMGKFNDPKLTTAKLKQLILNSPNLKDLSQLIKLSISTGNQDWHIRKDGPIIKGQFSARRVSFVYKAKDGYCYYVKNIGIGTTYLGGGKYSLPRVTVWDNDKVKIICSNVK